MNDQLAARVAAHLGWTVEQVRMFSRRALRDLVTSAKLKHEMLLAERSVTRWEP